MSRERGRSHRGLVLAGLAAAACLANASPVRAECVIEGRVGGFTVRTASGRHVRVDEARPVRVTPLRRGVFALHPDEGSPLEGVIFESLPLFVGAEEVPIEGELVVLAAGTPLDRADHVRGGLLRVEAALGDGVRLVRAWVSCAHVRVGAPIEAPAAASPASAEPASSEALPRGAPWHARTLRLSVFPGPDAGTHPVRLHLSDADALLFTELRRDAGFVYVRAFGATGARLRGWIHASDLRPAPRTARD